MIGARSKRDRAYHLACSLMIIKLLQFTIAQLLFDFGGLVARLLLELPKS